MPHPHIRVERDPAGFLRVALARQDRRNALDLSMVRALLAAFADEPAAPVVLGSADPRVFCAGADLAIPDADRSAASDLLYECYEVMITRPGAVIAVIAGAAVGGGAQLATAADVRVAGPLARFRWLGPPNPPLAVGAWVLPSLVGRAAALELTLTGRWLEAAEAADLGLVNRIDADPDQIAGRQAESLVARGAEVVGRAKMIACAGGLLDRLHAERAANGAAWARMMSLTADAE